MGVRESLLNTITSVADSDFVRIVTSAGASSKATVRNLFKGFESNLSAKSSLATSDYIRVVGSDNDSYKQSVSDVMSTMGVTDLTNRWGTGVYYTGNIDTLYTSSIYVYNQQITTGTFPTTNHYGTIVTLGGTSNNYATQIAKVNTADGAMYVRYRQNGTWTAWQKLPTRAEVDALSTKVAGATFLRVEVPSGGVTVTLSNGYRGTLYVYDSSSTRCSEHMVGVTGTGNVTAKAISSSTDTIDTSVTNKISITPSTGSRYCLFITVLGTASV